LPEKILITLRAGTGGERRAKGSERQMGGSGSGGKSTAYGLRRASKVK